MNGDNQKNSRNRFNGNRPPVPASSPYTNSNHNTESNRRPPYNQQPGQQQTTPPYLKPVSNEMSAHQLQFSRPHHFVTNSQDAKVAFYPTNQQQCFQDINGQRILFYQNPLMPDQMMNYQQHFQIQQYQQLNHIQPLRPNKVQPQFSYNRPISNPIPFPRFSQQNMQQAFIPQNIALFPQQQQNLQQVQHQHLPQNYPIEQYFMPQPHYPNYHSMEPQHIPNLSYHPQNIPMQSVIAPTKQPDYSKNYYPSTNNVPTQPPENHKGVCKLPIIDPATMQEVIIGVPSSTSHVSENKSFQDQTTASNTTTTTSVITTTATVATTTTTTIINVSSSDTSQSTATTKLSTTLNSVDNNVAAISNATINTLSTATNVVSKIDRPNTAASIVATTDLGISTTTLLPSQHVADVSRNDNTTQQQTTTTEIGVLTSDKQDCQQQEQETKEVQEEEDDNVDNSPPTQVNKEECSSRHVDEVATEMINKCSVFEDVEKEEEEEEEDDDIKYATPSEEPENETAQEQSHIINSITSHFQTSNEVDMSNNNVAVSRNIFEPNKNNNVYNTTPTINDETTSVNTITNCHTTTKSANFSTSFTSTFNNKSHTTTITNNLPIMMNKPVTTTATTPPTPERRVYSRDFLLSLRNLPQCNRQVEFQSPDMTEIIRRDETGGMNMYSHSMYRAMQQHQFDNILMFNRFPQYNKRLSQKRDFPPAQQAQRVINVQLDSQVQLHTTDNAWKPTKKKVLGGGDDENNAEVEGVYKKTRSILNKLTPQNFPTLLQQLKLMTIDTEEKLAGCINLVFEKAISEPKFCEVYAQMANEISVNVKKENEEVLSFRKLLINRCQTQFEKERTDEIEMLEKQKQIDECSLEDDKKLLILEKEELLFKSRRRSLGNIRFIGELFKMKMLTHKIMFDCWFKLMLADDVDSLECLCWLVKTIGKELDIGSNKEQFDANFSEIVKKANSKNVQLRTKFMLQDLLDLRRNKWVPRRKDNNPKTIEQIHQEAQKEEQEKQLQMTASFPPQQPPMTKNNRQTLHRGSDSAADEWNTMGRNNMRNLLRTPIDHSKLKIHRWNDTNVKLEPSRANWTAGSNNNSAPNIQSMNCNSRNSSMESEKSTSNRFSVISGDHHDNFGGPYNRHGNKNHTPPMPPYKSEYNNYNSLPHRRNGRESLERKKRSPRPSPSTSRESSSNRDSRHNKSHNYSSASQQKKQQFQKHQHYSYPQFKVPQSSMDTPLRAHPAMGPPEPKHPINRPPAVQVDTPQFKNKVVGLLEEYMQSNIKEAIISYEELNLTNEAKAHFITTLVGYAIEKQTAHRSACSRLLAELLSRQQLDLPSLQSSLSQLVNDSFDLEIDVPRIWENLSDVISDVMRHCNVNLFGVLSSLVHDRKDERQNGSVVRLVTSCLLKSLTFYGQDRMVRGCAEMGVSFENMMNIVQCPSYAKFNSIYKCESLKGLTCDMLQQTLNKPSTLAPWIEEHRQLFTEGGILSRNLMTAVCMAAIKSNHDGSSSLDETEMSKHMGVLKHHLSPEVALDALQELDHALEHPSNLLNSFFQMFYEYELFTKGDFINWSDTAPNKAGKGIALTSTEQFISHLRES